MEVILAAARVAPGHPHGGVAPKDDPRHAELHEEEGHEEETAVLGDALGCDLEIDRGKRDHPPSRRE
jgi:hypothetical protein